MGAALALPILAIPARAGAAEVGEVGITTLYYRERGLIKVVEPIAWLRLPFAETWELRATALVDIVTGASPEGISNLSGRPLQTITGASVEDRRTGGDVKLTKKLAAGTVSVSRAVSDEDDYVSRAFGLEGTYELPGKATTLSAGFGRSKDRIRSSDEAKLDARRDTKETLFGLTQVLSPTALVQGTVQASRGRGYFNDPYKLTLTFRPGSFPLFAPDTRPDARNVVTAIVRYRQHVPSCAGTWQADYRYHHDNWGVRAHTLEAAWSQDVGDAWKVRPALRYYTQTQADFWRTEVPAGPPANLLISSDPRLAAFGGISPSVRVTWTGPAGLTLEATAGATYNAASLRPGGGSPVIRPLRASFLLGTISKSF